MVWKQDQFAVSVGGGAFPIYFPDPSLFHDLGHGVGDLGHGVGNLGHGVGDLGQENDGL